MKTRVGHDDIETTEGYVKMAEDLSGTIGQPFPPLPAPLLSESPRIAPGRFEGHFPAVIRAGGGNRTPDLARMKRPL
jgi:hypothetical protein